MEELAKVISIKNNKAKVRVERTTACKDCGMCAFKKDDLHIDLVVDNKYNAKEGDTVYVKITDASPSKIAFIVYGIPLVLLFVGLFIGKAINGALFNNVEIEEIVFGAIGMAIGLVLVRIIDKITKNKYLPVMTGIKEK